MDQISTLRLFISIVEQGSLSAAARLHQISLSSVSQRLQQLEKSVGITLLQRTTRSLSLTAEGEIWLNGCRNALAELDGTTETVRLGRESLSGSIMISAPNDIGRRWIAPLLAAFTREHPHVHCQLDLSDQVMVLGHGIDIALRIGQLPDSALVAVPLLSGSRRIVASPDYWNRHGRPQHPNDLRHHRCMILTHPGSPQHSWQFVEQGRHFEVAVQGGLAASDGDVLRRWALDGEGVILKSHWDVQEAVAQGKLETVLDDFMPADAGLHAVMLKDRFRPRRFRVLIDYLRAGLDSHNTFSLA